MKWKRNTRGKRSDNSACPVIVFQGVTSIRVWILSIMRRPPFSCSCWVHGSRGETGKRTCDKHSNGVMIFTGWHARDNGHWPISFISSSAYTLVPCFFVFHRVPEWKRACSRILFWCGYSSPPPYTCFIPVAICGSRREPTRCCKHMYDILFKWVNENLKTTLLR